ncbi:MAG: hypothetical protein ACOZIN_14625 [Myxococcota bacterium]
MRFGILAMAVAVLVACGDPAPPLPPKDSMTVDFSAMDNSGALIDPNAKTHWTQAAVRVGILNLWIGLGLTPEVAVFHAAFSQKPKATKEGWEWSYSVKNLQVDATATLSAKMDGKASVWEMRVNGKVGNEQLTNFLWYDGRYEVSTGHWQIYNQAGKLVRIDWTVNSPTDKQLKFTNNTGTADDGAFVDYKLLADAASVSYDLKQNKQADIAWSVSTKVGSITAADYTGHENQKACWNAQLFDAACP